MEIRIVSRTISDTYSIETVTGSCLFFCRPPIPATAFPDGASLRTIPQIPLTISSPTSCEF